MAGVVDTDAGPQDPGFCGSMPTGARSEGLLAAEAWASSTHAVEGLMLTHWPQK